MLPLIKGSNFRIVLAKVVLPAPLGPTIKVIEPMGMPRLTSFNRVFVEYPILALISSIELFKFFIYSFASKISTQRSSILWYVSVLLPEPVCIGSIMSLAPDFSATSRAMPMFVHGEAMMVLILFC